MKRSIGQTFVAIGMLTSLECHKAQDEQTVKADAGASLKRLA